MGTSLGPEWSSMAFTRSPSAPWARACTRLRPAPPTWRAAWFRRRRQLCRSRSTRPPPRRPPLPGLIAASDSGQSSTDNITKITTPTFTGTAEPNSTVELFRNSTISLGKTTASSTGAWTIASTPLSSGTYSITVKATDIAGNLSIASPALAVTIDTIARVAPSAPDLTAASDTGTSNTDNITSVSKPTFVGTGEVGAIMEILANGTVVGTSTVDVTGNWMVTTGTLAPATYTITARATDFAGNIGAVSPGLSVTIQPTL